MRTPRAIALTIWLWGPVVLLMAAIFTASAQPDLPAPPGPLGDKEMHALVFGALAALLFRALAGGRWSGLTWRRAAWAAAGAVAYGLTDELHQRFVPGRLADLADVGADALGASLATALLWACGIIHARRQPCSASH